MSRRFNMLRPAADRRMLPYDLDPRRWAVLLRREAGK
jgi:hypothetical protein